MFIGFQKRDKQDSQNLNNDTFYRPILTTAQRNIGTEKYPDAGILLNHDDDNYSQGYGQTKNAFKALTSFTHIYLSMILDQQTFITLERMTIVLDIIYTFSIYVSIKF